MNIEITSFVYFQNFIAFIVFLKNDFRDQDFIYVQNFNSFQRFLNNESREKRFYVRTNVLTFQGFLINFHTFQRFLNNESPEQDFHSFQNVLNSESREHSLVYLPIFITFEGYSKMNPRTKCCVLKNFRSSQRFFRVKPKNTRFYVNTLFSEVFFFNGAYKPKLYT